MNKHADKTQENSSKAVASEGSKPQAKSKSKQSQAHDYTQGTDIHVTPEHEKHIPHEAWHVEQNKQ